MLDDLSNICYFLSAIAEIPDSKLKKLEQFFGGIENIYARWDRAKTEIISFIGQERYSKGSEHYKTKAIKEHKQNIEKLKIKILTRFDNDYPESLNCIEHDRVNVIYYAGDIEVFKTRMIAVVGTRNYSDYGRKMAREFSTALSKSGLTIVSGLATGIDTFAHRSALDANGKTIAVLGSGLKKLSPQSNAVLARSIAKNGIVLSEYSPFTMGAKYTYPHRNRIISALSEGVLIVEADTDSGALYTATSAIEYGKHLFCIPGNADSFRSHGVLNLIRSCKSALVYSPEHILEELNIQYKINPPVGTKHLVGLDAPEFKLLEIIDKGETTYDELKEKTGLKMNELTEYIFSLQLKGLIETKGNIIKTV